MSRQTLFADVILPLPVGNAFTYRVPFDWNEYIQPGQRVVVQFGKNKLYTAIVRRLHHDPPKKYQAKYLENILDEQPLVSENQMLFWDWMAEYYMAYPGDVLNAALPGNLKLSSETNYLLHPDFIRGEMELLEWEEILVNNLESRKKLTLEEIATLLQTPKVHKLLKTLIDKRVITSEEELGVGYKPKLESFIRLLPEYNSEEKLNEWFKKLEKKAPKQVDVLLACLSWYMQHPTSQFMPKKELVARLEGADGALRALVKKNVLEIVERKVDRLGAIETEEGAPIPLTPAQQIAKDSIQASWEQHEVVLLHGVTSSGKTEIYIHLIEECLKK
ncbi:MAG: primosomal protein N', partial [Flavobacteriales bacterium]